MTQYSRALSFFSTSQCNTQATAVLVYDCISANIFLARSFTNLFSSAHLDFIKLEEKSAITFFQLCVHWCVSVCWCVWVRVVDPKYMGCTGFGSWIITQVNGLSSIPSSVLLQGVYTVPLLAHILLRRISEQTWLIGPLTWYGDWEFMTESCCRCCTWFWLLKYFPTMWFLDCFILIKWYSSDNFDFTTSWKWHPQVPCKNSLYRPIVIANVSTTS